MDCFTVVSAFKCIMCVCERAIGFCVNPMVISLKYKEQRFIINRLFFLNSVFTCSKVFLCCNDSAYFDNDLSEPCAFRVLSHTIILAAQGAQHALFVQKYELFFFNF